MSNTQEPISRVSIICAKGGLDEVYPALILANGARMEGIEATLFFTFFGMKAVMKATYENLKVATVGNSALNLAMPMMKMPVTIPFPTLIGAIPGVSSLSTWMMKREMEELDIPPVGEFLEMISDAGAGIFACKLAMDMFKLTRDDLIPQVEGVLTVGEFYAKSAGASIIFT
ncbi:MAG: DsrE/DsrF/DrsH-like family protein [Candidatus Delongbacteria bacterium]|nr:DsrE/DsrF/DrsH-like family protein [bacterium]MBL7033640.1 DsrE/DsrF/DrsH-like family protein [Candidatus Delongbacteria bacterium]